MRETSAKRFEKENPRFGVLSEGTKYVLNAPGKDWNLDLSMTRVRICNQRRNESLFTIKFASEGLNKSRSPRVSRLSVKVMLTPSSTIRN